jgi:hypothetical protein
MEDGSCRKHADGEGEGEGEGEGYGECRSSMLMEDEDGEQLPLAESAV